MSGNNETNPLQEVISSECVSTGKRGGIDRVLHAVRTHLGMDVAFISQFRSSDRIFKHVDAPGYTPIHAGDTLSLDQGYCQRVVDGRHQQLALDGRLVADVDDALRHSPHGGPGAIANPDRSPPDRRPRPGPAP